MSFPQTKTNTRKKFLLLTNFEIDRITGNIFILNNTNLLRISTKFRNKISADHFCYFLFNSHYLFNNRLSVFKFLLNRLLDFDNVFVDSLNRWVCWWFEIRIPNHHYYSTNLRGNTNCGYQPIPTTD